MDGMQQYCCGKLQYNKYIILYKKMFLRELLRSCLQLSEINELKIIKNKHQNSFIHYYDIIYQLINL